MPASSTGEVSLEKILASGVRDRPDVAAVASRDGNKISVLIWHYHDDDVAGDGAAISLEVTGLGRITAPVTLTHYRIDERHSNSYAEWKRRGSPAAPDQKLYAELEQAGGLQLLQPAQSVRVERGSVRLSFDLPRQGVSLIELSDAGAGARSP